MNGQAMVSNGYHGAGGGAPPPNGYKYENLYNMENGNGGGGNPMN